jgi:predicted ATPase
VGPGGAGKTRLATETALTLGQQAPDGIWFVELAPLGDPADVAPAILSALGVSEYVEDGRGKLPGRMATVRTARDRLLDVLAERRVMLVLDNCEHLVAGVADLTEALLGRCPILRVLTTSREPLGIEGEQLYPVGSLGLPPAGGEGAMAPYPSVQLFVDRATAVNPVFALTAANADAVAEICRRLDGMPLAIELAAARMRSMSPEQIVDRLADRFRLLTSGSRTALPRHQTLRAVVEWSWELLDGAERTVARRLSVFSGGATLDAAERVCCGAGVPADDVLPVLASLVDKSLLEATDRSGTVRYWMLETVRAFSAERLTEAAESEAVRRVHAGYFGDLVEQAAPKLRTGEQLIWIARLDADHDNLLGALRYAVDAADADLAIRLVAVLGEYWNLRGRPAEAVNWLQAALELRGPTPVRQRMYTLFMYALGSMAAEGIERTEIAQRRALRALAEIRHLHRRNPGVASFENTLADSIWAMVGHNRSAGLVHMEAALDDPDPWNRSAARMMRAMLAENEGDVAQMHDDLSAALAGFRSLGDRWGMSMAQRGLASFATQSGQHEAAIEAFTESLRLLAELGTREGVSMLVIQRGQNRMELGDLEGARADFELARELSTREGDHGRDAFTLAARGALERRAGNLDAARELTDAALAGLASVSEVFAPQGLSMVNAMRAAVALDEDDLELARTLSRRSLELGARAEDMPVLSAAVEVHATVELAGGDPARAARLLGLAAALRGMRSMPTADVRRTAERCTTLLGETAYQLAYDGGASLSRAAAYAELGVVPGSDQVRRR